MAIPGRLRPKGEDLCLLSINPDADQPHASSQASSHLTVSIGVATARPDRDARAVDLLRAADVALYQAKRLGRNRVVSADALDSTVATGN